ncbi:MAG: T9SS type A sorting domain-containing protein, partial [Cyclobacteriaceae bacterium]
HDRDFALVQLDADGNVNWYEHFTGLELRMNVASDPATGDIGIVGMYEELDFVDSDEYLYDGRAVSDYFIARFDRSGSLVSLDTTEYESVIDRISFNDIQFAPLTFLEDNSLAAAFKYNGINAVTIGDFTFDFAGAAIAKIVSDQPLNVDLGPDILRCEGTEVLDAGPGDAWLWSTGASTRTIEVSSSGTYSVTVYDSDGNSGFDEINVTFQSPIVYQLPGSYSGFGSVSITATADAFAYQWSTGETTRSITVRESGTIGLTLFTEGGCETYTETSVDVTPLNIYAGGRGTGYSTSLSEGMSFLFTGGNGPGYATDVALKDGLAYNGGSGGGYGIDSTSRTAFSFIGGTGRGYSTSGTSTAADFLFAGGMGKGYDVVYYENTGEVTGIDDPAIVHDPAVYPNPATTKFYVRVKGKTDRINIALYNRDGKLVYYQNNVLSDNHIDITNLPPGLYMVEVKSVNSPDQNTMYTKLIIK